MSSKGYELVQLANSLTVDATGTITDLNINTSAIEELVDINLAIAPEVLEIQVDAPDAGQDTMWKWTWLQSTLPYARRTITNSNELNVPLYKQGTYVVNNFAAYDIHGSMTQTHSLYLKWIDGAGTDNLVSWATSAGPISDTHPDINGGAATDVQRITVNVPSTITPPTLTNPSVAYTVTNTASGSYTFSGAATGNNPNIGPFYRGGTYTININATGHPFYFTTDNGTNFAAGTYFGEYTSGVTGSRTDSGTITFTVPAGAPDTLYYQCGNHSVMRGEITVKDLAVETNINGNYVVYFQHTQEGHKTPVELRPIPSLVNQMCLVYDSTSGKFVPQDLATYVENTPSFENKIREVAGTAELVVADGSAVIAKVNVYADSTYLPLTGNNPGDQAFATDTDILYIWDGSAWQQAGAANSDDLTEGSTNLFFTNERVDDRVSALIVGGNNITSTYNDAAGTLTIDGQPGYTDSDVGTYLSTNGYDTATNIVASITDSAPATLDTLNELAAALGDDPNFATTVTNSIATKLPLAGGTMTGAIAMGTNKITSMGNPTAAQDAATKAYVDTQISGAGIISNIIEDTTPQLGGNLDANGNNILLDNDTKISFGSDTLQVKTDGSSNSIIQGSSTTYLRGSSVTIGSNGGSGGYPSTILVTGNTSTGHVEMLYGLDKKFETTSTGITVTGIDVTGTATTDILVSQLHLQETTIPNGTTYTIPSDKQMIVESLDIIGDLDVQGTLATISGGSLSQTTMKTQAITHTNNTNAINIASDGNIGIGNVSPTVGLEVGTSTSGQTKLAIINQEGGNEIGLKVKSRTNRATLQVSDNDTVAYVVAEDGYAIYGTSGNLASADMVINGSGNVGIGTTSPGQKLTVAGGIESTSAQGSVAFYSTTAGSYNQQNGTGGTAWAYGSTGGSSAPNTAASTTFGLHHWNGSAWSNPLNVLTSGNVGIGTTDPKSTLDTGYTRIYNSGAASSPSAGKGLEVHYVTSGRAQGEGAYLISYDRDNSAYKQVVVDANNIELSTNSVNRLSILSGGNVGIGTTNPKAPLHVDVPGSADGFAVGGKTLSMNTTFQTGAQLEITLGNHQACYVKVFITGDWSGHSAMAFLGEYFIQNGANAYQEAGMIIREVDNTGGPFGDHISSMIYDGGNYDSFQIQFKLNTTSGTTTSAANLTYQVMGQFDSII